MRAWILVLLLGCGPEVVTEIGPPKKRPNQEQFELLDADCKLTEVGNLKYSNQYSWSAEIARQICLLRRDTQQVASLLGDRTLIKDVR